MAEAGMSPSTIPDARQANWLDRFAPAWLVPYGRLARWDRPIGWWLLLWPCWWAAALAAVAAERSLPDLWHLALFLIGAIAMRGAGCTYNDLVDRDIDAMVERTRSRPVASGAVSPLQATIFLALQAFVGLVVLLQFNRFTILLGFASLLVVAVYPFMKRISDWPQFVLGLAFSWGALVGWTAAFDSLAWPPVLLYCAAIAWTIGYDTIYAHQDKEDDAIIGVRSTALLFGARTKPALTGFYGLAVILMAAAFVLIDAGPLAFAGLLAAAGHLGWQVASFKIDDADNCLARFRANRTTGWIIFAGLVLDALLRA
ncbi:MAG TPA: 4-hydroxybenzoate octaprenyltransferase [Afifellaceae bacterium]|nr:4-hydroxybenzoate octaprenyltransferase [Afifellaceae bacterium]